MQSLVLSEKYRPKTIDDIILLPRIKKYFINGVSQNYIFYGNYGTGKTSLARILIGKYSKDKPYLELNGSVETSIDTLRTKIEDFCSTVYMGFDLDVQIDQSSMKYVFIDEFERASSQYQDALKAFIEKYHKKVRFILTTNHINKVSAGIKSRFTSIDFDCDSPDEEKYLKNQMYKRVMDIICVKENFNIPKDNLISLINKSFPDFRAVLVALQDYQMTGEVTVTATNVSEKLKQDLYSVIFGKDKDYDYIYHFLMSNFGADKIDIMFRILGRSFINHILTDRLEYSGKLFEANYIVADYTHLLETNTDPIVLGMTVIGKLRDLFN